MLVVCLGTIATSFITLDYFAQVLVVQPSMVLGHGEGIALLTQYNPTGLFILLEDLGYLLLAATLVSIEIALPSGGKGSHSLRWTLGIVGCLALLSFALLAVRYGIEMALPF